MNRVRYLHLHITKFTLCFVQCILLKDCVDGEFKTIDFELQYTEKTNKPVLYKECVVYL